MLTPDAAKALDESIAHWERIIEGADFSISGRDCALCQLLICEECPLTSYGLECDPIHDVEDYPLSEESPWGFVRKEAGAKMLPRLVDQSPEMRAAIYDMYVCLLLVREAETQS